ncbi:hypothetical protein QL285_054835 [Trifolium repens]|nr:hypothetical protein QL285_054835 [Trifolium repens]
MVGFRCFCGLGVVPRRSFSFSGVGFRRYWFRVFCVVKVFGIGGGLVVMGFCWRWQRKGQCSSRGDSVLCWDKWRRKEWVAGFGVDGCGWMGSKVSGRRLWTVLWVFVWCWCRWLRWRLFGALGQWRWWLAAVLPWTGFLSWLARKGEVRRLSVLTDDVALSYLQDVSVMEWCRMVKVECVWILLDTRVSDHFQIW